MVSYCLSIVTTVVVMLFSNAQPALLYIVPFILCSSMLTAVTFGEVKSLMDFEIFDDEEEEEEDKKKVIEGLYKKQRSYRRREQLLIIKSSIM